MGRQNKAGKAVKAAAARAVRLGPDLRIAAAGAIYGALCDASLGGEARVVLDGGAVDKADAAGLQAVLAGRRALEAAGKSVAWSGCTPQLRNAAELLGLAEALELPR